MQESDVFLFMRLREGEIRPNKTIQAMHTKPVTDFQHDVTEIITEVQQYHAVKYEDSFDRQGAK